jgi:hypothetical protein
MVYMQQKVNQQVNRPHRPKAKPSHLKALAEARKMPRVRVEPVNAALRDVLKHPNGMAFRNQGSVEWPLDRFTKRRLREGSIRIVEGVAATQQRRAPQPNARQGKPSEGAKPAEERK